jgi:hypothetical protein|tara:strand:- start:138 stop:251 length:114 start_codon:yes stop_codon:yes gene_type:complete
MKPHGLKRAAEKDDILKGHLEVIFKKWSCKLQLLLGH